MYGASLFMYPWYVVPVEFSLTLGLDFMVLVHRMRWQSVWWVEIWKNDNIITHQIITHLSDLCLWSTF